MMRRHMLHCLSHLAAFLAGTALTYYSIAREAPRGFSKTFPTTLSEALTFYREGFLTLFRWPENAQAGRATWEYLYLRLCADATAIRFLNCSDNIFAQEVDREWFAKFRKENKVWHINFLKRMMPESLLAPNVYHRLFWSANPELAISHRVREKLRGFPPEVIMAEEEEEKLKLFVPMIVAMFLLGRDVPGLGKTGDFIWLVGEPGRVLEECGPVLRGSASNYYFINARTAEMVALLPPQDESLLRQGIVSRVLYWPEGIKPSNK